jgi:hypothetical protein
LRYDFFQSWKVVGSGNFTELEVSYRVTAFGSMVLRTSFFLPRAKSLLQPGYPKPGDVDPGTLPLEYRGFFLPVTSTYR